MKTINDISDFCHRHNITEDQFFGRENISGSLYLRGLTSIPQGFNPTVGGDLDLSGLTSIPQGFNPTVGGSLYLRGLTSIPQGFNPTVGGYLDLRGLTSIPQGFNPTVGGSLYLRGLTSIPQGFNPTVGGDLDLSGLTSIPQGFNPTVGGSLYLSGLTSIPQGFNLTVGGSLYWKNGSKHIGADVNVEVDILNIDIELTWKDGKYSKIDGIFCEIVSAHAMNGDVTVIRAKKVNRDEFFFIAKQDRFYAHGKTVEQSVNDLNFKIVAEKLKKEPITKDTEITVMYYRTLTGACDLGCRDFMERHAIPFKIENGKTVELAPMKAVDLLPILEKSSAYGVAAFKKLVEF